MTTVAIIQAREGSSRLPGKVLKPIQGKPMIARVVQRAEAIPGVTQVVVAIPSCDMALRSLLELRRIPYYSVPEPANVLRRVAWAARCEKADVIIRLTGDSPCLDPALVGALLREFRAGVDYAHNLDEGNTASYGTDAEIFTRALLDRADAEATEPYDREHVTPWIRRHAGMVRWRPVTEGPRVKLSVDTIEDLELVRAVYARVGRECFSWDEARGAAKAIISERNGEKERGT